MRKPDPIETMLNHLASLRENGDRAMVTRELRAALKDRSNLVIAKAAAMAAEFRLTELIPDMVAAFERLMKNPAKLDKRCAATFAIATALHAMDYLEPDVYLAGIRHIQMEASFGPPVDEGAKLRAQCALGLVRTRHPQALLMVAELLADKEPHARLGATRAFASNGGDAGVMLLRYKALIGDKDPEVLAEVFAGLLSADLSNSLPFVARFMDSDDSDIAESAVLAIASQRDAAAFEALREKWDRSVHLDIRKVLLTGMATMRMEIATEFLLDLLQSAPTSTAVDIVRVLAAYHRDDRVRERIATILENGGNPEIRKAFRESW
ncbi:MAG TPA: hypothetical protein VG897_14950 [Terriglobales bacterium]|nr:hypothetical protein [Terriglobales bacterium]